MSSEVARVEPTHRIRSWERDAIVWEEYAGGGVTMAELAIRHGVTEGTISRIVNRMRNSIPLEQRIARQNRALAEMDEARAALLAIMRAEPAPAYSNGHPIYMPDGTLARDYSARMKAIDLLETLHAREARALGTDAPTRIQAEVRTVNYVIEGVNMEALR